MEQLRFQYKKFWYYFKKHILIFIRSSANSTFHCHSPNNSKLITTQRLGLSHLWFHKFKNNFQDTLNPICSSNTVETTIHHLLHCNFIVPILLFNKLQNIDENTLSKDDSNTSKMLLFGEDSFSDIKNTFVLTASIEYILSRQRFDVSLYQNWHLSICVYAVYF